MNLLRRNNLIRSMNIDSWSNANYFKHPLWQLIVLGEQLSGTWPYQNKTKRYSLQLFHFIVFWTLILPMANKMKGYIETSNMEMIMECCLFITFAMSMVIKLTYSSACTNSRRRIYEKIANHFKTMSEPEEAKVLNEHTIDGFKYSAKFIGVVSLIIVTFDSILAVESICRHLFYHVELDADLPLPMDYGFDHKKYWYVIAIDFFIAIMSIMIVDFTYDVSFILQVRHVRALFKIVGMRVQKATELVDPEDDGKMSDDAIRESHSLIISAIDLHSEGLEMVKLMEKTYTYNWFVIFLLTTSAIGALLHAASTKLHNPVEFVRYILGFIMIIIHFQVIFSNGQHIIDSSAEVLDACYDSKWYRLPKKSSKLLAAMMMQASIPRGLTGAKLFPLSTESFGRMLKAGLSYYTVFET